MFTPLHELLLLLPSLPALSLSYLCCRLPVLLMDLKGSAYNEAAINNITAAAHAGKRNRTPPQHHAALPSYLPACVLLPLPMPTE